MNRTYKNINSDSFINGIYSLVPIRDEDKYDIMNWRNNQLHVLRQETMLSIEQQEHYFKTVVDKLFDEEEPKQLLFSFLEDNKLIGYGGLVHIDWESKNAEISFLTETSRSSNTDLFIADWVNYLTIIKKVANIYLNFTSIFTYAYDLRPNLYIALEKSGFKETERLKNKIEINNVLKDVVIHTFNFNNPLMRFAKSSDVDLYYRWVNNPEVRKNSFNQNVIKYEDHVNWFTDKINSKNCFFYLFYNKDLTPIGQVRIDKNEDTVIDVSIDEDQRGKSYSSKILRMACQDFLKKFPKSTIYSYIKKTNFSSHKAFLNAGFEEINNHNTSNIFILNLKLKLNE